jgi:hypothetical protein
MLTATSIEAEVGTVQLDVGVEALILGERPRLCVALIAIITRDL